MSVADDSLTPLQSRINEGTLCNGLTCMQKDCKVLLCEDLVKELIKDDAKVVEKCANPES